MSLVWEKLPGAPGLAEQVDDLDQRGPVDRLVRLLGCGELVRFKQMRRGNGQCAAPLSQTPPLSDLAFELAAVQEFAARRRILFGQLPELLAKLGHAALRRRTPVLLGCGL